MRAFWFRLSAIFRRRKIEEDLTEELKAHVEFAVEANVAKGMTEEEAREAARKEFGGLEQLKESYRDERGLPWLDHLLQDVRYAFRQLRKSPGFTIVAVSTLALGIGANTAVFSGVNAVLMAMLPVKAPEELVLFQWTAEKGVSPQATSGAQEREPASGRTLCTSFSLSTFEEFRKKHESLTDVFAFAPNYQVNVVVDGVAENLADSQFASGNYHSALGLGPAAGRLFVPGDDAPASPLVGVISYRYWQARFGGSTEVVGKSIRVNGKPVTIVGVTPAEFKGTMQVGEVVDLTLSLGHQGSFDGSEQGRRESWFWWVRIMGRMKPGVTRVQAQAEMLPIFQSTLDLGPNQTAEEKKLPRPNLRVLSGAQGLMEVRREQEKTLGLLGGMVGVVLLVACANVANLMLARGASRRRELAVRLALGASRRRIVTQLLAESLLLATLGSAAGLLVAWWGESAIFALQPAGKPMVLDLPLNANVLWFTIGAAGFTGIAFGLLPALRSSRIDLTAEFQGGPRSLGLGARSRLARSLVAIQVALAFVLLVGSGLLVRTLHNLDRADVGFERDHLMLFQIDAGNAGLDQAKTGLLYERLREQLGQIPQVSSVGYLAIPLLSGGSWSTAIRVPAKDGAPRKQFAWANAADPGLFATLRLPLVAGRGFDAHDGPKAPKVAIVNQALAKACFGEENPIGKRIAVSGPPPDTEIVGVARDSVYYSVRRGAIPTLYFPYAQEAGGTGANFVLRYEGDAATVAKAVSAAAKAVDPLVPIGDLRTQDEQVDRLFAKERMFAQLCTGFGLLTLGLAAVGLYGLVSYSVQLRKGEIGLRMALGALPRGIARMILKESLRLVIVGIAAGAISSIFLARFVTELVYGITAKDPWVYLGSSVVLIAAVAIAALIPSLRASRIDPMVALRSE